MSKKPTDMKKAKFEVSPKTKAFREFRKKLEAEGYFERSWAIETLKSGSVIAMAIFGTWIASSHPVIASFVLGIALQQAGWLGHDYGHGRGIGCYYLNKFFGQIILGFSTEWWSHKHNTHHCFPNRLEVDSDIHNEPFIHLWFPPEEKDVWSRRFQHIYYPIAYSFLHASWRLQSAIVAFGSGNWEESILLVIGYCWFFSLPVFVWITSVLISGFLVAIVVTCNHQTEEMIDTNAKYCFSTD